MIRHRVPTAQHAPARDLIGVSGAPPRRGGDRRHPPLAATRAAHVFRANWQVRALASKVQRAGGMKQARSFLGPAFEWCDRRCGRCSLSSGCVMAARLARLGWLQNALIDDLAGWEPVLGKVWSALDRALEQAGIDAASPHTHFAPPTRPLPRIGPGQRPLIEAMDRYYLTAFEIYSGVTEDRVPEAQECADRAVLLVQKILRIAAQLPDPPRIPLRSADERLYGNLILVDKLEKEQWSAVRALALRPGAETARFAAARQHFRTALDALLDALPRGTRAQLGKRLLARNAPSPFVVVEHAEARRSKAWLCPG